MKSLHSRKGGFTLIELMIVVAIIGILAAIAIPNFIRFQLRAKSSEGKTNLAAIRTAEESYFAEFGTYVAATLSPAILNVPPSTKQQFVNTDGVGAGFDQLGWAPEGHVYFIYDAVTGAAGDYTIGASANIDAVGANQNWVYGRTAGVAGAAPPAPVVASINGCTGALDTSVTPPVANLPNQVGPCDAVSGQSEF